MQESGVSPHAIVLCHAPIDRHGGLPLRSSIPIHPPLPSSHRTPIQRSAARLLRELHISNLAIIEDICIELDDGLNCFTGETGAGKSLVLGAFEILLGLRSASDMLRADADEGRISGLFELRDPRTVAAVSEAGDLTLEAGDQLLITRKLFASGRTSVSINGQPATAAMVRNIGQSLVDVHGQHDHQFLLKPANQLAILDAFADCLDLREQFAAVHHEVRELAERKADLEASQTLRRQQLDLYEFQAQEIDDADPQAGEMPELQSQASRMNNIQRLRADAGQAHAALHEAEDSILERLHAVVHVLRDLAELDEEVAEIAEQVRASTLSLQEGAYELARYTDRLELDPQQLAEIEDRLNILNRLVSKYGQRTAGDDPIEDVLRYRQQIGEEIEKLTGQDEDLAHMDVKIRQLTEQRQTIGEKLTAARMAAAEKLRPLVEKQLKTLGMKDAQLMVEFADGDDVEVGPSGFDHIEILVRTNPGQPARPLRKIASGGELSRIMLAIKSILAGADRISVLVFDEIDANIGGRLGTVIGQKLRDLTAKGEHQVLCITHLPQIAAYADCHLRIAKQVAGKQTVTRVTTLAGKDRIEELAEMLAGTGVTATTRKQAKELLSSAG